MVKLILIYLLVLKAATVFAFDIDKPKVHPMGWTSTNDLGSRLYFVFFAHFFQKFGTIGDYL
ncbi:MAG: hypothetical protein II633_05825 [Bacteroidales bacterium]|nr:hypothetical protein [Bacteroidales bacterium]